MTLPELFDPEKHGAPLTVAELIDRLATVHKIFIGEKRLADLRVYGGGPVFFKQSHREVRYPTALADQWALEKNRQPLEDGSPEAPSRRRAAERAAKSSQEAAA
jgi:hypothetical protein